MPRITIPTARLGGAPMAMNMVDTADHLNVTMKAFPIVGKYLTDLLTEEIHANTHPAIFNKYKEANGIGAALKTQLVQYAYQSPPFNSIVEMEPCLYWEALKANPKAEVLAVS